MNALKKTCNPPLGMHLLQEICFVCFQGISMERAGNEKLNVGKESVWGRIWLTHGRCEWQWSSILDRTRQVGISALMKLYWCWKLWSSHAIFFCSVIMTPKTKKHFCNVNLHVPVEMLKCSTQDHEIASREFFLLKMNWELLRVIKKNS